MSSTGGYRYEQRRKGRGFYLLIFILMLMFIGSLLVCIAVGSVREVPPERDLSNCHFIQIQKEKQMVCFQTDDQMPNALGAYAVGSGAIFLRAGSTLETVQHECLHMIFYKYLDQKMENGDIQHMAIKDFEDCYTHIDSLQKSIGYAIIATVK